MELRLLFSLVCVCAASAPDSLRSSLSQGLCQFGWMRNWTGQCRPMCESGCKHGECVGPDQCRCHPGFTGKTCNQDVNECASRPCKHRCMNTRGSYKCYCLNGFMLASDGSCRNARTCAMANCQYGCAVMKGEVRCQCPSPGLQLAPDGRTCVDMDECVTGQASCPRFRKCVNTFGSFVCRCHEGFQLQHLNGKYHCTVYKKFSVCYDKPGHKKCKCTPSANGKGYDCKTVVKVTIEPAKPVATATTPIATTRKTTTTAPAITTTRESTTTTTHIATTTMTTTPIVTTREKTTTTTPIATTRERTTTTPIATTRERTTTTPIATTRERTTTPIATTRERTTTTPIATTKVTITTTTATPTTTVTMTTSVPTSTAVTKVTPSTVAMTTAASTTLAALTTPAGPALASTTTAETSSTTTLDNRIHRGTTARPRGDVHIPRYENNLFDWDFDVELGNTDEYTRDDPAAGAVSCSFDEGLCVWMTDSEGDVKWELKDDPAGGRYLSVPEATSGRSVKGARLTVPLAPPTKAFRGGDLCLSFRHRLHGNHIGSLQVFVRKGRGHSPSVWSRTGGHGWRHAHISIWGRGLIDIVLKAERRRGRHGDVAVDDLSLRRGACDEHNRTE